MINLWQDIRYGIRGLRRSPGFTAIALVTLAIGIGANTIMFSVVNMLLFRPTQVKDPDELVCCKFRNFALGIMPYSAYHTIHQSERVFSDLMVQDDGLAFITLAHGESARQVAGMFVSANYFSFLGTAPTLGRGFLPEEEGQDGALVTVLSYRAWERLGADPEIVGQHVRVNGAPCEVVGVAPKGFTGVTLLGPDLWLPVGSYARTIYATHGIASSGRQRSEWWGYPPDVVPVGRLRSGLNMAAAEAQLRVLTPQFKEGSPRWWKADSALYLHRPPQFYIGNDRNERGALACLSMVLMGVSVAVLVIACLNLAAMMIVHGAGRHREIAVRLALGGGRFRIVRQLLVESGVLALLGGALGLLLAFWGTAVLNSWLAGVQMPIDLEDALRVGLNGRVLAFTLGFCLLATLLFGLRPALGLSRRDVVTELKESGGAMLQPFRRKRGRLSTLCQIALAVVLVMGAALFTRGAIKALRPSSDFNFGGKLLVRVDTFAAGYDLTRSRQTYEMLAERFRSLPDVESVSMTASFPFADGGGGYGGSVREYVPGRDSEPDGGGTRAQRRVKDAPAVFRVGADYFEAMGMPFLQGRPFHRIEFNADAEKVVIVDDRVARRLRPDGNALGCLITYGEETLPYRVVGIVPTLWIATDSDVPSPQMYVPIGADSQLSFIHLRVAAMSRGGRVALEQRIRSTIRETDPRLPIVSVTSLSEHYRNNIFVWVTSVGAKLAVGFGAMALFLASLGIYAVKGYMVTSRTPEIGIRKALGATQRDIMGMVFREGLVLTVAGLVLGLMLGLGVARLIASLLYGVEPVDVASIVITVLLLGIASLLAGYVPARRAARIDPMEALRYE